MTVGQLLAHQRTRYVLSWLLFISVAATMLYYSWTARDHRSRCDGNDGHATIDFGGQWLMGRMLVEGNARELYDRDVQRGLLTDHYPAEDGAPGESTDVENLMYWMMGNDDELDDRQERHVGGPLYPPVHAFLMAPPALLPPRLAYRVSQFLNVIEAILAGLAIRRLFGGRLWLPLAALMVMTFAGYSGSLTLGQNATLTLVILLWGWVFMAEGKNARGGAVWGLLAFKPVWALSFFLVPLITRRWRACLTMALMGFAFFVMTLPWVGWHGWMDWLAIGREAAAEYRRDARWISLSRDVLGLSRRCLGGRFDESSLVPDLVGWVMLANIFFTTVGLTMLHWRKAQTTKGPIPAFILLGAWLCCFHFMYYDVLLTLLPLTVLLTDTECWLGLSLVRLRWTWRLDRLVVPEYEAGPVAIDYCRPRLATSFPQRPTAPVGAAPLFWTVNSIPLTLIILIYLQYPIEYAWFHWEHRSIAGVPLDTYSIIGIWLWCGVRLIRDWSIADRTLAAIEHQSSRLAAPAGGAV